MKRKITTILLAMLLVVGTAIGLCACANQEDIDNAVLPVEQQVTLINTTLDDMKATDKTLNDSITALTGRVTTLEGELVEVNAKITSLQTDSATKAELENVKTSLQNQIDSLNVEITALKAKDTDLQNQIAALQKSLTDYITDVKAWTNDTFLSIVNWNTAKAQIESDITALNNKIGTIEATLETMNTAIAALQQQVTLINTTLDDMKATDKTLNDSITALTGRVTTLEGEIETAKNNIGSVSTALTQEIADRQADIKTLTDKDTELKNQITALETALADKEQGIKDWANGAFVKVTEWTAFKNEINTTIAGLTSRIETLEGSVGKINTTLTEMQATDKTLSDNITALTGRVTALETELVDVNAKITALETNSATKEQLETVKTSLQNQIDSLNAEITALKAKDTDLQTQITALQNSLTSEITDVKSWATDTFLSIENWNTAKAKIESDITTLNNKVSDIETKLAAMDSAISALQMQVEQNKKDIEDLTIRVNCLEGKHVAEEIDETTYSWSNDFTTCVVKGICKHCGAKHDLTANSTHEGYVYKVSFINGKYTHQIDLTNLTDMDSTLQANALSVIFATKPTTLTLTLPKDFNSFSLINDPIKNYDDGKYIDLTLKGVETITNSGFSHNSHLKTVSLPNAIQINNFAFYDCNNLMNVSVEKVELLDNKVFCSCASLTEIELPSATSIGNYLFMDTYIERIKFGSVITTIGKNAFNNVDTSKCVLIFAEGQKKFAGNDMDGWEVSNDIMTSSDTEFIGNAFKKIFVGDIAECTTHDTEVIYKWSVDFKSCTAVSECKNCLRTFADETATGDKISVDGFVYTATFENALFSTLTIDLTDLTNFNEAQYYERLEFVFSQKNAYVTLTLPNDFEWDDWSDSIRTIIKKYYDDGTLNLTLKGVETIKRLGSISALKSINLPDAVEICYGAFYTCTELTEITANNVTKIGAMAFYQCASLTNVNLPKVSEIGDQAFYMDNALEKLTFGTTITKIGTEVFEEAYTDSDCTLTLAKGQKNFTKGDDGSFTLTDTAVVAGTNVDFCGYTFKEIKFAEE